jgi:ParB-like nuclease domain
MKTNPQAKQPVLKNAGSAADKAERVVVLTLSALKLDPEIQCRADGVNQKTVEHYEKRMKAGDDFPALDAVQTAKDYLLADGFQRHAAALLAGFTSFKVRIHPGTRRDAVELAITKNLPHGRQFSSKDKRRVVEQALKYFTGRSDGTIAELCHVSQSYVSRIHRQLRTVLSCEGGQARMGRDGKIRKMPLSGTVIRRSSEQKAAPKVSGSNSKFGGVPESRVDKTASKQESQPGLSKDGSPRASVSGVFDELRHLLSVVECELNSRAPVTNISLEQLILNLATAVSLLGNRSATPGEVATLLGFLAKS